MKAWISVIALMVVAGAAAQKGASMDNFSRSLRQFTASMYDKIVKGKHPDDNIFFSPNSIAHTLGMILAGARGNTAKEITRALEIPPKYGLTQHNFNKLYRKVYNKLFNTTRGKTQMQALMASRMFLQEGYPINDTYTKTLEYYYDSDVAELQLENTQDAADTINNWVKEKTDDLIKDLIKPDSIDAFTRLILVNALYFKAAWENKWYKTGYENEAFHAFHSENPIRIPFIGQKDSIKIRFLRDDQVTQIGVPYKDEEAYLIIMMPRNKAAFEKFTQRNRLMTHLATLGENFKTWATLKINVSFPMFDIEKEMDVKEILTLMGVRDLFDSSSADLGGVAEEQLYVSMFQHKAKVTVDEQGTIAAAATGTALTGRSAGISSIAIDQPFLFAIYRMGNLLFFGRYMGPEEPIAESNSA